MLIFFFFFSSRRRHTRYWRDWSSDVCSSDLSCQNIGGTTFNFAWQDDYNNTQQWRTFNYGTGHWELSGIAYTPFSGNTWRSEERRVGKECRSRWAPYH